MAAPAPALAQQPQAALVQPLASVALYPERDASAQVVSLNESRIAAEIAGRIAGVDAEVGQRIARGAVIARIDCRDHELAQQRAAAALDAARARLALAEQQLSRARELRAQGFFAEEALAARATEADVLRADAAQAAAQRETAARSVEKCVVRAPFAAIVRERLGRTGELAAPGTPLAVLVDVERIEVSARVQAKDAPGLAQASGVRFSAPGEDHPLALLRVSPAIDPQTRTVEARLRFTAGAAPPGAAGRIAWRDPAPHLPPELIVRRGGTLGIFLEARGVARFHALPEAQEGRPARVALAPDARIVVRGQLALEDGQRLR
ncbi:MAG: efflux RND transporter periplasmic adaptor subunit [Burkholderiales bacterium]